MHDVATRGGGSRRAVPPGWNARNSSGREAAALEERDGERVAERQLHQRRGGRRQAVRAGLAPPAAASSATSAGAPSVQSGREVMATSGDAEAPRI